MVVGGGMQTSKEEILDKLAECVIKGDTESVVSLAKKALELDVDAKEAIEEGLARGVRVVGDGFGKGELFLPDLMMSAVTMKMGMDILEKAISGKETVRTLGKIVIGTVEGDIHDLGKNLVAALLRANGFTVYDLGVDVPAEKFVEKVKEVNADVLAISALLTTTMPRMIQVIQTLEKEGLRNKVKVLVGGAPVTEEWARRIGADAYGGDASEAVTKSKGLLSVQ